VEVLLRAHADVRRLAGAWLLLALAALALSTACAVLLIAARLPLPGGVLALAGLFRSALVLHVGLAVVVWFLSAAAALWTLAAGGSAGRWRWSAPALSGAGVLAMMAPLFSPSAPPVLANYIPVLDSPVFLLGLSWFLGGIALCGASSAGRLLARLRQQFDVWRFAALMSILVTGVALLALAVPVARTGVPGDALRFEVLAWGPGHVLQFVHVLLLMSVWAVMGEQALGRVPVPRALLTALLAAAALPVLATPFIYFSHPVDSAEFRHAFTLLMAWSSWPAAALLGLRLLWQLLRERRAGANLPLLLSILLFLLGCAFGASIRGESTMVPAHYHGTVGAITLAYMAFGYRLLPVFGYAAGESRLVRQQPVLYGIGLIILAAALAWSGWLGVPRKTLHVDVLIQYPAYFAAMGLAGLGGLLAISGAGVFVFNVARSLRGACAAVEAAPAAPWISTLALAALVTLSSGALLARMPQYAATPIPPSKDPAGHVAQMRRQEIRKQFDEGVALLGAKQYQAAASALHRVLELAPQMPEAHVNMGFAMIGLEKHAMARDFFEAAIALRTGQINAYYGLALALEGTGDIAGALGAMRTYVHRSKQDDPYLRKANAAIWEWEEQLARSRSTAAAAIPENGKEGVGYPIIEKRLR
jgi:tetratricopeptide (TPR) repeat protein